MSLVIKNPPVNAGNERDACLTPESGRSPGGGHSNHYSTLAWRIPWTEEPGGLQSMGSQRVGHDWSDLACMLHRQLAGNPQHSKIKSDCWECPSGPSHSHLCWASRAHVLPACHGLCLSCGGQSALPWEYRYLLCSGLWPHCSLWEQCPHLSVQPETSRTPLKAQLAGHCFRKASSNPSASWYDVTSYPTLIWKGAAPPQLGLVIYGPDLSLHLPTWTQNYVTLRKGNTLIFLFPSAYYLHLAKSVLFINVCWTDDWMNKRARKPDVEKM